MTKEEAKSFLVDISYDLGNMAVEDLSEKDGEKMREAIKALEQQPCDDCVSRQAVLEQAIDYGSKTFLIPVNSVKALPPVTPQPKRGHWIAMSEGFSPYECSECESVEFKKSKYCPNCGCYCGGDDKREVQDDGI